MNGPSWRASAGKNSALLLAAYTCMLARAIVDRMMQVRLRLQGKAASALDGIKAAVPGATVNYAQGCDTSCTSTTGFGAAVSVRAEKRIHGSDQQSCSPGVPARDDHRSCACGSCSS
jgi:hypothetical protein